MANQTLSDREMDVLRLLARGNTQRHIADRLSVSPETVKTHLRHIYQKLCLAGRDEACEWYWSQAE